MSPEHITAIVLAAGKGTRMKSPLPKVLHPVAGIPMIVRVIDNLKKLGIHDIRVIVGHGEKLVRARIEPMGVSCFLQKNQNGTADAVKSGNLDTALEHTLIVSGDHPLLRAEDLAQMIETYKTNNLDLAVASIKLKKPGQFGRIVRYHGKLFSIVEAKDASKETLEINEVNSGLYLVDSDLLRSSLNQVSSDNAAGEFYLTDIVEIAREQGCEVDAITCPRRVGFGVNNQKELAMATRVSFRKKAMELMENGAVLIDPERTYVEDSVEVGSGTVIGPGVHLRGQTRLGDLCVIEENCHLDDCEIGSCCHIKASSYLQQAQVEKDCEIGPFARLGPEVKVGAGAKIGNFVEMSKTEFGAESKAKHLAYIGNATVGKKVNVGCGTITCNYSVERKKHSTVIGDDVFVGSDSQLVAPVEVGDKAVIGSGSTITRNVPSKALAVTRIKQTNYPKYVKD